MKIYRLSPLAIAVILAACGGSSSSPTDTSTSTSGVAVDGYISGATVTCDVNSNGIVDASETNSVTTNNLGAYSITNCSSPLILKGGTNIDTNLPFEGLLRAPVGSAVITPLTNLVALGLTNAQLVSILGLPADTDVTKLDPAAKSEGLLVNPAVYQKTLAVQHLIQQTADVIFSAASITPSAAQLQAQYALIAKTVASELAADPASVLISSSGDVTSSLVLTLIEKSVDAVKASEDEALTAIADAISTIDSSRVATFLEPTLTTQVNELAIAEESALTVLASRNGNDTVLSTLVNDLSDIFESDSTISLENLEEIAATSQSAVQAGVITGSTIADLNAAGVDTDDLEVTVVNNYYAIADDLIILGTEEEATPYTLTQLEEGTIEIDGPEDSMDDIFNLSFALDTVGAPTTPITASLGFELVGTGSNSRIFRFVIDQVTIERVGEGEEAVVTAAVPATAQLGVYARKADDSEAELTLTNVATNTLSSEAGTVMFNAGWVITQILNQANAEQANFFETLLDQTGTFTLKAVLSSTVPIRKSDTSLLSVKTVTADSLTVSGPSVSGTITVN